MSRRSARRCARERTAVRVCLNSRGSFMSTQRTPSEARAPRMDALARLPVFYALTDKRTIVAGGSAAAAWKAELLAAAGAKVDVFAANVGEEMAELASNIASITLHSRAIQPSDFAGAAMAI